jgi:hypothetical protein
MVIIKEQTSLQKGQRLTVEEFVNRVNSTYITEITLNSGVAVLTLENRNSKRIIAIVEKYSISVSLQGAHQLSITIRDIKGIEETSHCFYIKCGTNDIWLKK